MEQMKQIITKQQINLGYQSSDHRPFAEKQADWYNNDKGNLNLSDGIDCPKCKNKGKIAFVKKPYEDSEELQMYLCDCECLKKRKSVRFAKKSGMGSLLKSTVESFTTTEVWQQGLKRKVISYMESSNSEWLCVLGQSGSGKTHLCSAVANSFLNKGIEVRYCVWGIMMKELKQDAFSSAGTRELMGKLQNVPVLYIDDLFKGIHTPQDDSLMFDLLNFRYNMNLITIITSELLMDQLAEIDIAIAGRIRERCGEYLVQLRGNDKNYRFMANR